MKIFIGADHRGYYLKEKVFKYLKNNGYNIEDIGGFEYDPNDDFPEFAHMAVSKIRASDEGDSRAILICGGAQGMGMAANRYKGIRASVVWEPENGLVTTMIVMFSVCPRESSIKMIWKTCGRRP